MLPINLHVTSTAATRLPRIWLVQLAAGALAPYVALPLSTEVHKPRARLTAPKEFQLRSRCGTLLTVKI